jgi:hypothetical protein
MAVEIIPVETQAELKRFIRVPMRLSKKDPSWVAPLIIERLDALSRKVNPFFQHADVQFWLARKDGRDVGSDRSSRQDRPRRARGELRDDSRRR